MKINSNNFYTYNDKKISRITSYGDQLRQARESMGLSQQKIASSLCLKLSIIKSIEEGYLEKLEIASIFLYGYIRSYARLVGVDPEEVTMPLLYELNPVSSVDNTLKFKVFYFWKYCKTKINSFVIVCCVIFICVIVMLLAIWYLKCYSFQNQYSNTDFLTPSSFFVSEQNKNNSMFFLKPSILNRSLNVFYNNIFNIDYIDKYWDCSIFCFSEVIDTSLYDIRIYKLYGDMIFCLLYDVNMWNKIYDFNRDMLTMSFTSDCWIEVFDDTGERLYVGTQHSGNILNLQGKVPYKLVIGAPQSIEIKYQGNIINLEKFIHPYKVARLIIPG